MHVALQTARNQASLEMPLRAEELMTAHFNLVVLSNEIDTTLDADPSTSTAVEQTYVKIPIGITLQIAIQRSNTLSEPLPQPVEETTDLLMEYQRVTRLMTLGQRFSYS